MKLLLLATSMFLGLNSYAMISCKVEAVGGGGFAISCTNGCTYFFNANGFSHKVCGLETMVSASQARTAKDTLLNAEESEFLAPYIKKMNKPNKGANKLDPSCGGCQTINDGQPNLEPRKK